MKNMYILSFRLLSELSSLLCIKTRKRKKRLYSLVSVSSRSYLLSYTGSKGSDGVQGQKFPSPLGVIFSLIHFKMLCDNILEPAMGFRLLSELSSLLLFLYHFNRDTNSYVSVSSRSYLLSYKVSNERLWSL